MTPAIGPQTACFFVPPAQNAKVKFLMLFLLRGLRPTAGPPAQNATVKFLMLFPLRGLRPTAGPPAQNAKVKFLMIFPLRGPRPTAGPPAQNAKVKIPYVFPFEASPHSGAKTKSQNAVGAKGVQPETSHSPD